MFEAVFAAVRQKRPLVHAITNYVTIRDCANIMLACGGSPIMADAPEEAAGITSGCDGLVLNLGMLNETKKEAMRASAAVAAERGKPVVLDPVGVSASPYRLSFALELLRSMAVSVIRGNASEIRTLSAGEALSKGVDAVLKDDWDRQVKMAKELSLKYSAVTVQTGEIDLVTDGQAACLLRNGTPMMGRITGSGCMLSALTGVFCAASPEDLFDACSCAACMMGLAGEAAAGKAERAGEGLGSFGVRLVDEIGRMDETILNGGMKLEIRSE